ncbi:MAG TPA: TadE/TadG family type IV pilus assembly protein [Candidatus Baltobacteraceae bacterium]|nr:TadE/TadG family type IV pilus assembly protein [Candidatus Baltobacteraceae bacterium]
MQLNPQNARRGGALVEFAVILPIALVFLFGIVEFGIAMFEYHATNYAAKYAARYASVRGASCSATGCPITASALQNAVRAAVPGTGFATVSPQWTTPPSGTYVGAAQTAACDSSDQNKGCFVIVTVTQRVPLTIPFVNVDHLSFKATSTAAITQ